MIISIFNIVTAWRVQAGGSGDAPGRAQVQEEELQRWPGCYSNINIKMKKSLTDDQVGLELTSAESWVSLDPWSMKMFLCPPPTSLAKSAPQKARNRNKARTAKQLRKLSKDCVNVNNEK